MNQIQPEWKPGSVKSLVSGIRRDAAALANAFHAPAAAAAGALESFAKAWRSAADKPESIAQIEKPESVAQIVSLMADLSSEQRLEVMSNFCKQCGDSDPNCHCWNDD